ncbi:MAG: FAD:protein FMN transferase, partial [Ktedonobacterales bacterium]
MEMTNTLAAANYFVPIGMAATRFHAMGTTVAVLLPSADADSGFAAVRELFATWESALSRFLPESELSRLNANAGAPMRVSPLLWTVLARALDAAATTVGRYDPSLRSQLVGLGYDRSFEQMPADADEASVHAAPGGGWRRIVRDHERHIVTLPVGVGLDFGGIAKGMAVD